MADRMPNTIAAGWEAFERVYGTGSPITPHQRRVMKLCYFAGASQMLCLAWNLGEIDEAEAVARMKALSEENDRFIREYLSGVGVPASYVEEFLQMTRPGHRG